MGKSYKLPVLFLTLLILLQVVALEATIVAGSTSSIKEGGMHSLWDYRYVYFSEFPSLSSHRVKVTGRVVDDYGNPLEDANVELISQGVHDFERTDANGRFSFYVYPKEASYWIIVEYGIVSYDAICSAVKSFRVPPSYSESTLDLGDIQVLLDEDNFVETRFTVDAEPLSDNEGHIIRVAYAIFKYPVGEYYRSGSYSYNASKPGENTFTESMPPGKYAIFYWVDPHGYGLSFLDYHYYYAGGVEIFEAGDEVTLSFSGCSSNDKDFIDEETGLWSRYIDVVGYIANLYDADNPSSLPPGMEIVFEGPTSNFGPPPLVGPTIRDFPEADGTFCINDIWTPDYYSEEEVDWPREGLAKYSIDPLHTGMCNYDYDEADFKKPSYEIRAVCGNRTLGFIYHPYAWTVYRPGSLVCYHFQGYDYPYGIWYVRYRLRHVLWYCNPITIIYPIYDLQVDLKAYSRNLGEGNQFTFDDEVEVAVTIDARESTHPLTDVIILVELEHYRSDLLRYLVPLYLDGFEPVRYGDNLAFKLQLSSISPGEVIEKHLRFKVLPCHDSKLIVDAMESKAEFALSAYYWHGKDLTPHWEDYLRLKAFAGVVFNFTAEPTVVGENDTATLIAAYHSYCPIDISDAEVNLYLEGLTAINASSSASINDDSVSWELGEISYGDSGILVATCNISKDFSFGYATQEAYFSGYIGEECFSIGREVEVYIDDPPARICLEGNETVVAQDRLVYTITLENKRDRTIFVHDVTIEVPPFAKLIFCTSGGDTEYDYHTGKWLLRWGSVTLYARETKMLLAVFNVTSEANNYNGTVFTEIANASCYAHWETKEIHSNPVRTRVGHGLLLQASLSEKIRGNKLPLKGYVLKPSSVDFSEITVTAIVHYDTKNIVDYMNRIASKLKTTTSELCPPNFLEIVNGTTVEYKIALDPVDDDKAVLSNASEIPVFGENVKVEVIAQDTEGHEDRVTLESSSIYYAKLRQCFHEVEQLTVDGMNDLMYISPLTSSLMLLYLQYPSLNSYRAFSLLPGIHAVTLSLALADHFLVKSSVLEATFKKELSGFALGLLTTSANELAKSIAPYLFKWAPISEYSRKLRDDLFEMSCSLGRKIAIPLDNMFQGVIGKRIYVKGVIFKEYTKTFEYRFLESLREISYNTVLHSTAIRAVSPSWMEYAQKRGFSQSVMDLESKKIDMWKTTGNLICKHYLSKTALGKTIAKYTKMLKDYSAGLLPKKLKEYYDLMLNIPDFALKTSIVDTVLKVIDLASSGRITADEAAISQAFRSVLDAVNHEFDTAYKGMVTQEYIGATGSSFSTAGLYVSGLLGWNPIGRGAGLAFLGVGEFISKVSNPASLLSTLFEMKRLAGLFEASCKYIVQGRVVRYWFYLTSSIGESVYDPPSTWNFPVAERILDLENALRSEDLSSIKAAIEAYNSSLREMEPVAEEYLAKADLIFEEHMGNLSSSAVKAALDFRSAYIVAYSRHAALLASLVDHLNEDLSEASLNFTLSVADLAYKAQIELDACAQQLASELERYPVPDYVVIVKYSAPTAVLEGEVFNVTVQVKNIGELPANSVTLNITSTDELQINDTSFSIGTLNPHQAVNITFRVKAIKQAFEASIMLHLFGYNESSQLHILYSTLHIPLMIVEAPHCYEASSGGTFTFHNNSVVVELEQLNTTAYLEVLEIPLFGEAFDTENGGELIPLSPVYWVHLYGGDEQPIDGIPLTLKIAFNISGAYIYKLKNESGYWTRLSSSLQGDYLVAEVESNGFYAVMAPWRPPINITNYSKLSSVPALTPIKLNFTVSSKYPINKTYLMLWRSGYYTFEEIPAMRISGDNLNGVYQAVLPPLPHSFNATFIYVAEDSHGFIESSEPITVRAVDSSPPSLVAFSEIYRDVYVPLERLTMFEPSAAITFSFYDPFLSEAKIFVDGDEVYRGSNVSTSIDLKDLPAWWHHLTVSASDSLSNTVDKELFIFKCPYTYGSLSYFANKTGIYAKVTTSIYASVEKSYALNLVTGEFTELNFTRSGSYYSYAYYVAAMPLTPGYYTVFAVVNYPGFSYTVPLYKYMYANVSRAIEAGALDILNLSSWRHLSMLSFSSSDSSTVNNSADIQEVQVLVDSNYVSSSPYYVNLWICFKVAGNFSEVNASTYYIDLVDVAGYIPSISFKIELRNGEWSASRVQGSRGEVTLLLNSSDVLAVKIEGIHSTAYILRLRSEAGNSSDQTCWKLLNTCKFARLENLEDVFAGGAFVMEGEPVNLSFDERLLRLPWMASEIVEVKSYYMLLNGSMLEVPWIKEDGSLWRSEKVALPPGMYTTVIRFKDKFGNIYVEEFPRFIVSPKPPSSIFRAWLSNTSLYMPRNSSTRFNVFIEPVYGAPTKLNLSVEGLPSSVAASFNKPQVTPPATVEVELTSGNESFSRIICWVVISSPEYSIYLPFSLRVGNQPPNTPTLIEPENNSFTTRIVNYLDWRCEDPDGDRLRYTLLLGRSPRSLQVAWRGENLTYSYYKLATEEKPLPLGETVYWKVIAEDEYGAVTESQLFCFHVKSPIPIENLTVYTGSLEDGDDEDYFTLHLDSFTPVLLKATSFDYFPGIAIYFSNWTAIPYEWRVAYIGYNDTGDYYFYVCRAYLPAGDYLIVVKWGAIDYNFTAFLGNRPPKDLVIGAPANDTTLSFEDSVKFSWLPESGEMFDRDFDRVYFNFSLGSSPDNMTTYLITSYVYTYLRASLLDYLKPLRFEPNATYYWKITAWDPLQASSESPVYLFTTSDDTPPTAPQLLEPANESTDVSRSSVELTWSRASDAEGYFVHVVFLGESPTSLKPVAEVSQHSSSYTLRGLKPNATYYWKIAAMDYMGLMNSSEVFCFTTNSSNAPPRVAIRDGAENESAITTPFVSWLFAFSDPDYDQPLNFTLYLGPSREKLRPVYSTLIDDYQGFIHCEVALASSGVWWYKVEVSDPWGGIGVYGPAWFNLSLQELPVKPAVLQLAENYTVFILNLTQPNNATFYSTGERDVEACLYNLTPVVDGYAYRPVLAAHSRDVDQLFNRNFNISVALKPGVYALVVQDEPGAVDVPFELHVTYSRLPVERYMITLRSGWNLVSLPVDTTVELESIHERLKAWYWDPCSHSYEEAQVLVAGKGYWVYSPVDSITFMVEGAALSGASISIHEGWNLIGTLTGKVQEIFPEGKVAPYLFYWDPEQQHYVEVEYLEPCKAYWLYAYEGFSIAISKAR